MRDRTALWLELRELAWLASAMGALSVLGVVLALGLVFMLDGWQSGAPAMVGQI